MRRLLSAALLTLIVSLALPASYTPTILFQSITPTTKTGASTSEQSLVGAGIGLTTLQAGYFSQTGVGLRVKVQGYYSSGTITTQTLVMKVKFGSTAVLATSAITPLSTVTNGAFDLDCDIVSLTVGSMGTVQPNCHVAMTGTTLTPADAPMVNTSAVTVNTTATQAVDVTVTWGGSPSSSQTITATNVLLIYEPASTLAAVSGGSKTPNQVTGLQGWYSAGCISFSSTCMAPSNATLVSAWYDQSTNANALNCPNNPEFFTNQVNSQPAVTFAPNNVCQFANPVAWGGGISVFVVASDAATTAGALISATNNGFELRFGTTPTSQSVFTNVASLGTGSTTLSTSTFYEIDVTYDGTTSTFGLNHMSDGTGTQAETVTGSEDWIGANGTLSDAYLNGKIAEIFWYNNVVSSGDKTALRAYITGKYGL